MTSVIVRKLEIKIDPSSLDQAIREAEHYLDSANQPGEGFAVLRVTQEAPHRWRSRLSPHEALVVQKVLDEFPLALEAV